MQVETKNNFFIQVGSWKNLEYADEILAELAAHYPDAYTVKQNNFHKIRIPDINSKTQGNIVIKDIKNRFNLTPILVKKTN